MERKCNRCGCCCENPTLELRPPQYSYFKEKDGWIYLYTVQGYRTVRKIGKCDYLGKNNGTFECTIYERRPVTCEVYKCEPMEEKRQSIFQIVLKKFKAA